MSSWAQAMVGETRAVAATSEASTGRRGWRCRWISVPRDEEEEEEVVGEDEDEHREGEQVQVHEERRVPVVAPHVANRVEVDEEAHPGHEQRHRQRQRVGVEAHGDLERTGWDPRPQ